MLIMRSIAPLILAVLSITSLVLGGAVTANDGRAAVVASRLDGTHAARSIRGLGGCKGGACDVGEALHDAASDLPSGPAINVEYSPGGVLLGTGSPLSPPDAHLEQELPHLSHLDSHAHALGRRGGTPVATDYLIKYYVGYAADPRFTATYNCSPVVYSFSTITQTRVFPGSSMYFDTECTRLYDVTADPWAYSSVNINGTVFTTETSVNVVSVTTTITNVHTVREVADFSVTAYYNYTDTVTHTYPVTETYQALDDPIYYTVGPK